MALERVIFLTPQLKRRIGFPTGVGSVAFAVPIALAAHAGKNYRGPGSLRAAGHRGHRPRPSPARSGHAVEAEVQIHWGRLTVLCTA